MKLRIAGVLLACALIIGLLPSIALAVTEETAPAEQVEVLEQVEPVEEPGIRFTLDGVELEPVTLQYHDGVYFVSVSEMMAQIDASASLEEGEGLLALNADTVVVTGVDPRDDETEDDDPPEHRVERVEDAEGVLDTLAFTARVDDWYVEANGRYLFVDGGVREQDGQILVPIRVLARALNLSVAYDHDKQVVSLYSKSNTGYIVDGSDHYVEEDLYWLSRVIHAESGNQAMEGQIAVGNVVMNRVRSKLFPDTIHGVLAQKNQFSTYKSGAIQEKTPGEDSIIAAKLVLDGAEVVPTALFFNMKHLNNSYAARNREYVCTIGNHAFYQ